MAALSFASPASAFAMPVPNCEQLLSGSDVVVLARPVSKTHDTGEGADASERMSFPLIWVETRFQVVRVLQGHMDGATFVLHHQREPTLPPSTGGRIPVIVNGPPLVSFAGTQDAGAPEFALFVVRDPQGRYAPYPNQLYVGLWSIVRVDRNHEPATASAACEMNPFAHPLQPHTQQPD